MSDSEFAKVHLREHLGSLIVSPISEGFWSIYSSSKELCDRNNQPSEILRTFQNMITRIPEWSSSTLTTEVERIQKITKCGYLDDLIMGVFIAYMKSFASLHYQGSANEIKVEFERPSLEKFIHELYKHSARKLWQIAYLFKTVGVSSEQQARNRQEVEKVINECLEKVIREFLPWEAIAKKYFVEPEHEKEAELEPEPEPEKPKTVSFEEAVEDDETIKVSEDDAKIDFEDLDKDVAPNTLDEIAEKASETLVLKL